jgi:hypothetical protein
VLAASYSLSLIASLKAPMGALARFRASWDERLQSRLKPLFDALGEPPCAVHAHRALQLFQAYVQLVVVAFAIAALCGLACWPFWDDWSRSLRRLRCWRRMDPDQVETALEFGEALALAGLFGALWLLVAPYPAKGCSVVVPWLFLRPTLITTVAYGFGCLAAAFASARAPARDP